MTWQTPLHENQLAIGLKAGPFPYTLARTVNGRGVDSGNVEGEESLCTRMQEVRRTALETQTGRAVGVVPRSGMRLRPTRSEHHGSGPVTANCDPTASTHVSPCTQAR